MTVKINQSVLNKPLVVYLMLSVGHSQGTMQGHTPVEYTLDSQCGCFAS